MQISDALAALAFFIFLTALSVPMGLYLKKIFSGEATFMTPCIRPLEKAVYRLCGIDAGTETGWKGYAWAFSVFSIAGIVILFLIQILQGVLPLNPQKLGGVRWDSALNTSISFVTNTNWQSYGGESTMSYLTQMAGLSVQNFLSAAAGMAIGAAFIRGFIRKESATIGNFWVDLTRSVLYILLPLSILVCILLVSQGVVQSFHSYTIVSTIEGQNQTIPLGPAASQIAIKQLGTNGGGFFGANSAHPFENPAMFSNLLQSFCIMFLPVSFVFMFGFMARSRRQARAIFAIMAVLTALGLGVIIGAESTPNPALAELRLSGAEFNMEGKETRFGVVWSALWSEITTITSSGSVNAAHSSFMPLSGMIQMFNIGVGEVIFGGVGTGLAGMLFYIILSMFIAGLMIGRTPEFMGKKLGPYEMVMAVVSLMVPMLAIVIFSAIALSVESGVGSPGNPSSHGLSEVLYAYASCAGNNGSAFAGLNANTPFYNLTTSAVLLIGRFASVIPALAAAQSLARKKTVPESGASFPTTGILFIGIVVTVIIIISALDLFPVFTLGPILEHLSAVQPKGL